jgi:hypothetical protein
MLEQLFVALPPVRQMRTRLERLTADLATSERRLEALLGDIRAAEECAARRLPWQGPRSRVTCPRSLGPRATKPLADSPTGVVRPVTPSPYAHGGFREGPPSLRQESCGGRVDR